MTNPPPNHPSVDHLESAVAVMADHARVVVCGGPRCGKTAVSVRASERYGRPVLFGDSLIGRLPWSEASLEVSEWFDREGEWIVEGVVCVRALRKWLHRWTAHEGTPLPFRVVRLTDGVHDLSSGQDSMTRGEATVWDEIEPALADYMLPIDSP